jgi:YVTN family beta-propeller protein
MKYILLILFAFICYSSSSQEISVKPFQNSRQKQLPCNRLIQPAGTQIFFGDQSLENHSMDAALSPDGKWLAVMERSGIVFIRTADNKVKYYLKNNSNPNLRGGMNTYSGITWYSGNRIPEIWWSVIGINDRSFVVSAKWDGIAAEFSRMFEYKASLNADMALPNEILITKEASKEYLYVVLNGNNQVIKQDFITGDTIWTADPGVAPYGITRASGKLYVTNWAGRFPEPGDKDVAGVPWGLARVDNTNAGGATREGSVTVLDPASGKIIKEVIVGLHPNEIISDKREKFVYVTNSNSDNVSVINTSGDTISETISVRLQPLLNPFFGDSPDALCLSPNNKSLYVANGMDNAVAVIILGKSASVVSKEEKSFVTGFIPTGAYPSAITLYGSSNLLFVTLKGKALH